MSASVTVEGLKAPRIIGPLHRFVANPQAANSNFRQDIIRCFNGDGGGIGFYGYEEGGQFYTRWLAENDVYRSQITLAEIELTTDSAQDVARLCPNAKSFLQIGASGSYGVFFNKPFPLIQALTAGREDQILDYKIADVSEESFRKNADFMEELKLNFAPQFIKGNFYASLFDVRNIDAIYVPGISIENPYSDAIKNTTESILYNQFSYFRRSLSQGGIFVFSFANNNGIDAQGSQLKAFYDDPLIHAYQKTIFTQVKDKIRPSGDYKGNAFEIRHDWHENNYVLTRHAVTTAPMSFAIGRNRYAWEAGHETYISNNTRYPDEMINRVGLETGFADVVILGPPKSNLRSNMRIAVLING